MSFADIYFHNSIIYVDSSLKNMLAWKSFTKKIVEKKKQLEKNGYLLGEINDFGAKTQDSCCHIC